MKFLILEQKFLELLEEGECIAAFNCLRQELAQLQINEERLATLAQVIMLKEIKQIRALTGWQGMFQKKFEKNILLPTTR